MTIQENIEDWMKISIAMFPKATPLSSLEKCEDEIKEIRKALESDELTPSHEKLEEYVDAIMCLLHSLSKYGFTSDELFATFQRKLIINKMREWKLNSNNTYSHIRPV